MITNKDRLGWFGASDAKYIAVKNHKTNVVDGRNLPARQREGRDSMETSNTGRCERKGEERSSLKSSIPYRKEIDSNRILAAM